MKKNLLASALVMMPGVGLAGMTRLDGHIDILPRYISGQWSWSFDPQSSIIPGGQHYFPAIDGDYFAEEGVRILRPEGAFWDILGVDEEEPVWVYPEQVAADTPLVGFGDTQTGVFSGPIRLTLAGVDGPPGGHFTLLDGVVILATSDGVTAADAFNKNPSHVHYDWFFSKKGMWRVRLVATAFLGPGSTNPTGPSMESPLYFAIGGQARWRADHFDAAVVMNEAVAGEAADPDGDGLQNAIEYVLGGDPHGGGPTGPVHGGTVRPVAGLDGGRLTLTFHRRQDDSPDVDLVPVVEWSAGLDAGWQSGGVETSVVPLAGGWERVTVRDNAVTPARFGRVRAVPVPTP